MSVVEKLFDTNFNISSIAVFAAVPDPSRYVCRAGQKNFDRFFYVAKGTICFENTDGSKLTAHKGTIVYLPAGVEYVSCWGQEEGYYISLHFLLYHTNGERMLLSDKVECAVDDKNGELYNLFKIMYSEYIQNQNFAYLKLVSGFYEIVYHMLRMVQRRILRKEDGMAEIFKAVIYLNDNYMSDITTEELAKMCCLSATVFRKQFKLHMGMSPMKYRTQLRFQHAREMLQSGVYTVSEISEVLNCTDISHFNKVYKAIFGKNPSEDIPKKR